MRKIAPAANRELLKAFDEKQKDLAYWLSRTPQERLMAVTTLIKQSLAPGQRMDRTAISQRKMRP